MNFIPFSLSNIGKLSGLVQKKGSFPHFFNTKNNIWYVGNLPAKKYYGVDSFKTDDEKKAFDEWYEQRKRTPYNHFQELHAYCANDTFMLTCAVVRFISLFYKISGVYPFLETITLSNLAFTIYRKLFMPVNKLSITPLNNYTLNSNSSRVSKKYLVYKNYYENVCSMKEGIAQTEIRVGNLNIIADGLLVTSKNEKKYLFFHGCW